MKLLVSKLHFQISFHKIIHVHLFERSSIFQARSDRSYARTARNGTNRKNIFSSICRTSARLALDSNVLIAATELREDRVSETT